MSISRKTQAPVGITNSSGQPEIVLELDGLVLSMKPPAAADATDDESEAEPGGDLDDD
jgi:hypothetical protein